MATIRKIHEHRKLKRFKVQEGAIAVLFNRKNRIGPVIDISRNGLAFRYVTDEKKTSSSRILSLFLTAKAFRMQKVPFKVVYDYEEKPKQPVNSMTIHRCGGRFGKLAKNQKFELRLFIKNYTTIDS